jgi:hypothetical protein
LTEDASFATQSLTWNRYHFHTSSCWTAVEVMLHELICMEHKKFLAFRGIKGSLLRSQDFSTVHFRIILPSKPGSSSGLLPAGFPTKVKRFYGYAVRSSVLIAMFKWLRLHTIKTRWSQEQWHSPLALWPFACTNQSEENAVT